LAKRKAITSKFIYNQIGNKLKDYALQLINKNFPKTKINSVKEIDTAEIEGFSILWNYKGDNYNILFSMEDLPDMIGVYCQGVIERKGERIAPQFRKELPETDMGEISSASFAGILSVIEQLVIKKPAQNFFGKLLRAVGL
jgi:hypothetical protein